MFWSDRSRQANANKHAVPQTSVTLEDLLAERHKAHQSNAGKSIQLSDIPGLRLSERRGEGLEFDDLRLYNSGDDVRHIDWNASARSADTFTRLYREERERSTSVLVDLRPSMFTGSLELRSVTAALLAARLLWKASDAGDRCSATTFSSEGIKSTRPIAGTRGVLMACELISQTWQLATSSIDQPDQPLSVLLDWLVSQRGRRGLNFLLSGLDDLSVPLLGSDVSVIEQKHSSIAPLLSALGISRKLVAVQIRDLIEIDGLPTGNYSYRDGGSVQSVSLNDQARTHLKMLLAEDQSLLEGLLSASTVPWISCQHEHMDEALTGLGARGYL